MCGQKKKDDFDSFRASLVNESTAEVSQSISRMSTTVFSLEQAQQAAQMAKSNKEIRLSNDERPPDLRTYAETFQKTQEKLAKRSSETKTRTPLATEQLRARVVEAYRAAKRSKQSS